jgi:hypothetical protein
MEMRVLPVVLACVAFTTQFLAGLRTKPGKDVDVLRRTQIPATVFETLRAIETAATRVE